MAKQTFGFSENGFSFGSHSHHDQVFPEHMNQGYFHENDDAPAKENFSTAGSAKEQETNANFPEKKESNLSIGSWALARGRRY